MVLSLAFILALVFSAIVLVIGIVIFGEIAEAMEVTLPTQGTVLPPIQANNEWQLREQQRQLNATTSPVDCTFSISGVAQNAFMFPSNNRQGWCHFFKVFDKTDLIGKQLTVVWSQDIPSNFNRIRVLDGAYDRTNATQFPINNVGASVGFTIAEPEGLLGGGDFGGILRTDSYNPATNIIDMTTTFFSPSVINQVTIVINFLDTSSSSTSTGRVSSVEVSDFAKWEFGTTVSSTFTQEVSGTENDFGIAKAGILTNLLPLILSDSDQTQIDTFNNAQAIGFTVIGILPVALFFALFSIFSGKLE